jgi:hypothetical protein
MGTTFGLVLLGVLQAAPEIDVPVVPPRLLRARVEAARKTYQVIWTNNREALAPFVELSYRWSRRWLEAELDMSNRKPDQVAAYQAHLARMRELERITKDRFRNRVNPIEETTAAEFYALEAEIWLTRARKR